MQRNEPALEGKAVQLMLKAAADGAIEGYASVFGEVDKGGDVVVAGAYAKSLAAMAQAGRRIKMLWQHDPLQPIGVWDEAKEDARGLWVRGRILSEVARGREAKALVDAGAMDGLSIGYRTITSSRGAKGERLLSELDLWEVSLVTFPMQPTARVSSVKSLADLGPDDFRDIEATLRTKGLSRADAVKAVSGFKDWLQRDAGAADTSARDERGTAITDLVRFMRENTRGHSNV
jgi:HK97 family phage prohead protease